jgi:hypothetical protein
MATIAFDVDSDADERHRAREQQDLQQAKDVPSLIASCVHFGDDSLTRKVCPQSAVTACYHDPACGLSKTDEIPVRRPLEWDLISSHVLLFYLPNTYRKAI